MPTRTTPRCRRGRAASEDPAHRGRGNRRSERAAKRDLNGARAAKRWTIRCHRSAPLLEVILDENGTGKTLTLARGGFFDL